MVHLEGQLVTKIQLSQGRFRYATVVLPELQSNLNVQDDDESDSPPSIRNHSLIQLRILKIFKNQSIRPKL